MFYTHVLVIFTESSVIITVYRESLELHKSQNMNINKGVHKSNKQ